MGYDGYDEKGGFRVKHLVLMVFLLALVLSGYIGWRMSDDALQVLVGVMIGATFIGVPGWVMAFMANRTRQLEMQDHANRIAEMRRAGAGQRPPLVLVQGGSATQQQEPAGWLPPPQLHDSDNWGGTAYGEVYGTQPGGSVANGQVREFGEL